MFRVDFELYNFADVFYAQTAKLYNKELKKQNSIQLALLNRLYEYILTSFHSLLTILIHLWISYQSFPLTWLFATILPFIVYYL